MAVRSTAVKQCRWYQVKTPDGWVRVLDILYAPDPKKPKELVLSRDYWLVKPIEFIRVGAVV